MEIKNYHIDCSRLNESEGAHAYLRELFDLPAYYGGNLDALYDCLTELPRFNIIIEGTEALNGYGRRVLSVIAAAAAENGGEIVIGHCKYKGSIDRQALERFIAVSMRVKKLEELIEGTELKERIDYVRGIYDDLERAQEGFCRAFDVSCRHNCCECCLHFMPDIVEAEAEYLAFGIIAEGREAEILDRIEKLDSDDPPCLLLDPGNMDHPCTEYQWRPLICRLFGDAASKDKEGRPTFRNCRWNVGGHDIDPGKLEADPEDVITMSDYGMRMEDVDVDNNSTQMLGEALKTAIEKVRYIISLEEQADRGTDDDKGNSEKG